MKQSFSPIKRTDLMMHGDSKAVKPRANRFPLHFYGGRRRPRLTSFWLYGSIQTDAGADLHPDSMCARSRADSLSLVLLMFA